MLISHLCNSTLLVNITSKSTIWEALSPCFSFVGVPFVPDVVLAPFCLVFLGVYGRFVESPAALSRTSLVALKISCALLSYAICVYYGVLSSALLHLSWFVRLLSIVPGFISLMHGGHPHFIFIGSQSYLCLVIVYSVYLSISLIMVGILCIADQHSTRYEPLDPTGKEVCPESRCSAFSVLMMWYTKSLIYKGLKSNVTHHDLWSLEKENRGEYLTQRFRCTGAGRSAKSLRKLSVFLWRLILTTKGTVFPNFVLVVVICVMRFMNALFLKIIVNAVEQKLPLWYSITALSFLFVFGLTLNLLYAKRDFMSLVSYTNIRSILIVEIFNKVLRLSSGAKSRFSGGEVMNIVTTDVNRIRMFWYQLRDFLYCPLLILFALLGLFFVIGWNTFYGIVVLLIILPFNYYVSERMTHYEQLQMKFKDARLKLVSDVLSGMRALKLYAWEPSMQRMIAEVRAKEVATLRKVFILDGFATVSFQFGPVMAIFASFYGYTVVEGKTLTPDVAFLSLMFFMMLRFAIYQIPQVLTATVKALVSGRRIMKLLNEEEQQTSYVQREDPPDGEDGVVMFDNCSFSWDNSAPTLHLRNVSLRVKRGELIGIVGRVGSGKSSLLSAIVGELECVERKSAVVYAKSVGYVPQQAWIQNKTLKGNIIFQKSFDEKYYRKTIAACALLDDLKLLSAGDLTEIGEKGINLSGGQRARVSLARAVYQQADLYILDDVLSAVDSHVGAHIFEKVIGPSGLLKNTTRIFALNSLAFLKHCDRIVVMHDGTVHDIATFKHLVQKNDGPFAELMCEYISKESKRHDSTYLDDEPEPSEDLLMDIPLQISEYENRMSENLSSSAGSFKPARATSIPNVIYHRQLSRPSHTAAVSSPVRTLSTETSGGPPPPGMTAGSPPSSLELGRLMDDEALAEGIVSRRVYLSYARVFGYWMCVGFFVTLFGGSIFEALSAVWLAQWSSEDSGGVPKSDWSATAKLAVYGCFGFSNSICIGISSVFLAIGAYYASISFHDRIVYSLLRSPMAFFDRTPLGRIMNRLSTDIDRIDESFPWAISFAFILLADACNSLISIVMVIPILTVVIVPLLLSFFLITFYFNKASVQFRRLSSNAWSKCCSFVQDAYIGVDSIRVYNVVGTFAEKINRVTDHHGESTYAEVVSNRWIQIQMDILTQIAIFIFILVAIVLGSVNMVTIGALALVISSCVSFSGFLGEIARNWREVEVQIVGIERVQEYIDNEHEQLWRIAGGGKSPPMAWPTAGHIVFENFCFRYRAGCELVLKNLSFEVVGGMKVGIVGRTGAGKSSITLALFRIVEPASGKILIDGVDITQIGLHDLREVLTIIPQDPVLFCGTLRSNLDPFKEFSDEEVWRAIEKAHLKEFVVGFEKELLHEIAEGGSNLSVGQRQLICLARALLRTKTKILILDEATAAVDPETDRLIQLSIREYFQNCTILTIAHRLNTVLDYDRILVMEAGNVAEYDAPQTLLNKPDSLFASLVKHAGISRESALDAVREHRTLMLDSQSTQRRSNSLTGGTGVLPLSSLPPSSQLDLMVADGAGESEVTAQSGSTSMAGGAMLPTVSTPASSDPAPSSVTAISTEESSDPAAITNENDNK